MKNLISRTEFNCTFIIFLLVGKVASRHIGLQYDGSDAREEESVLRLKGTDSSKEHCELTYGFLPCSSNIPSHLFLIVIYEYLLYHGESYAGGDGRIFRVLGKNFFVSSFSQLLDALPESLILLASGLSTSKDKAQDYVVTGAGLLAGSSILLLTLLWGVCFICARSEFYVKPDSKVNKVIQRLNGSGVVTDEETSYHAKVMFFSLIPFVVILLPSLYGLSYSSKEYDMVLLVSLSTSLFCLFSYFFYQYFDSRIRERRLEYAEVEQKVEMQVPFYEVQALMLDRKKHFMIWEKELEKKLKNHETIKNTITVEKFNEAYQEWVDGTLQLMDDPYSFDKSGGEYNQVVELLLEDKNKLIHQLSLMMKRALLLSRDGTQNGAQDVAQDKSVIYRFFNFIDTDGDGYITPVELKNFIMKVNYKEILVDDEVAEIMMRHLDIDGNKKIDKLEFITGVTKWFASHNLQNQSADSKQEIDTYHRAEAKAKAKEKFKAIILLIAGIFILTLLAEPLVESVRQFSEAVKIEPFYVSFILVPLATNARTAIAAIRAAKQKRHQTTSVTFSEIYHKVFMNNILGFSVLVSVIYFRGLTWHFSAEVLVVIIVCIIMGLLTSFKSKFPTWTLLVSFSLYPLSLVVVYLVNDAFQLA